MTDDEAELMTRIRLQVLSVSDARWRVAIRMAQEMPGRLAPLVGELTLVQVPDGRLLLVHGGDLKGGVEVHLSSKTSKKIPGAGAGHGV